MEASARALGEPSCEPTPGAVHAGPLTGLIVQAVLLSALASTVGLSSEGWTAGLICCAIVNGALAHGISRHRAQRFGTADWVTLARASLAVGVAALVAESFARNVPLALLLSITALALALDFADGWVARRTRTAATFGAWFDGEVDAFLILILSVYVARSAGAWVLAIGAARYAFLAAGWPLPWMRAPLPPRYWRKLVAATQGIALVVAAAGVLPFAANEAILIGATILLAESFGRDVLWLRSRRHVPSPGPAAPAMDRGRLSRNIAIASTVFAGLIVWAALVAPGQPQDLTATAFLRVPIEGAALLVMAVALPALPRRILAGLLGPALTLLVILKIGDIVFMSTFARPFDLLSDTGDVGIGIETLRSALGSTEANLIVYGAVGLAATLLVVITMSMFRLARLAADNRRRSLQGAAGLGVVWLLCAMSGAQLLPRNPIASASSAGYVVHEIGAVAADLHDEAVFAKRTSDDPFHNIPGSRLVTALRGKDVLLVFVESYGQVSVQGSSFSPAIDALLNRGTYELRKAGFSARSSFVNAPGFGGMSWLAHSTLQAGVRANSQLRYDQLVASNRFTLSDAFRRAGWRTIDFAPADDRSWPAGTSFYHYDKLYDRRDMGYRGPTFDYAPMPDQYMFAALQRLELARPHPPLFAQVNTVSSHMPWDRIPRMIPWNDLGNGSIFRRIPMDVERNSFWSHPNRVRAAYARSLEYSLKVLISFVQHYGKRNLVLVVVGDEQPLPIVSGKAKSHNVPISIIAHDPSVLRRIAVWGWQSGLLPGPHVPVMQMSAFRDRFLTAYGPHTDVRRFPSSKRSGTRGAAVG